MAGTLSGGNMRPNSPVSNQCYSITTYGISSENEWHASSITPNLEGGQDYVLYHKECPVMTIGLMLPGIHNVLNSLAVIAAVTTLVGDSMCMSDIIGSVGYHLSKFEGVSRRFEFIGKVQGCHIYDDYAHHPTEIRAVLQAARQKFPHQALWVVFQPHSFSRLLALMEDFTRAFTDADYVIVTEIVAGREKNNQNYDGRELASSIHSSSSDYIPMMDDVLNKLVSIISSDKNQERIILTVGSGDVTTLGPSLLRRLQT